MSQSRDKIVRRLVLANEDGGPVRVRLKSPWEQDPCYGYVLAVADNWVVVHLLLEGFHLDDAVILRLTDIKSVKPHPIHEIVSRIVGALGVPVLNFECAPESTASDLMRIVAERAELVCVYYGVEGFGWRDVGTIREVGSQRFELHAIDDDMMWREDSGLRPLNEITRVEFGGRYLTALERFGEEIPPPSDESLKRVADL